MEGENPEPNESEFMLGEEEGKMQIPYFPY